MNIQLTARHFKASEELKSSIKSEIESLEKFYEKITSCHAILDAENKKRLVAELSVVIKGKTVVAKASEDTMNKAVDSALDKISKQLKKINEKKHDHRVTSPKTKEKETSEEDEYEEY